MPRKRIPLSVYLLRPVKDALTERAEREGRPESRVAEKILERELLPQGRVDLLPSPPGLTTGNPVR